MRQFFLLFVLVAYIWAAPTGRPDIDKFDSNATGIARTAAKMQADWTNRQYAALLEVCPENRRAEAIRALVFAIGEGWADEAEHAPQLTSEQRDMVNEFEKRVLALEMAGSRTITEEELRKHRATQCVLYSEILAKAHAYHRLSPAVIRILQNEPRVVMFDRSRAVVQFCDPDRSKAGTDPRVTFEKYGARWTWPLADSLTLLLGEARRLELANRKEDAAKLLRSATAEEQKEARVERVLARVEGK
jgi:hypothetical protein